jgi:peptidoglycan/LPS O-acetylase OafA/YrhL
LVVLLDKGAMRTWNSCFLQFLWEFMLGMAIARVLKRDRTPGKWMAIARHFWQPASWWWWLAAGATAAVTMLLMELKGGVTGHILNDVPALAGYGMISVGVYFLAKRHFSLVCTFFNWIGSFSYALYLIHIIALDLLIMVMQWWGWGFHIAVIPLFLGFAFLLGLGLERVIQWVNYSVGSPQR